MIMKTIEKAAFLTLLFTGLSIFTTDAQRYFAAAEVNGKWGFMWLRLSGRTACRWGNL
jgi:hypothetical protein